MKAAILLDGGFAGLFLGIGLFFIRQTEQIICTDVVKLSQLDDHVYGIIQHTDLILRIGVLADTEVLPDLLLCIAPVDPQIADIFKFHNFVSHYITRNHNTIS